VIQSFADETAADLFRERNTRAARRIPREIWRIAQRKLKALDVAARLEDLAIPAGVTFRWEQGHAYEVRLEDYH
jgi:plasmid maintenance system killer protein